VNERFDTDSEGSMNSHRRRRRRESPLPMPQALDRLPPHSIEAEQGVLGCLLLDPQQSIPATIEQLSRGSEVFYDLRHQALYDALVEMHDNQEKIDLITLKQHLSDRNQLEALGGLSYISGLMNCTPAAASLEHYLPIIREKFLLRRVIQTCMSAVASVYDHQGAVDELLDTIESDVLKIAEERVSVASKLIKDLVNKAIDTIEKLHQNQGALTGLGTGFIDLDKMTSGLQAGDMLVIAARPSMGKTSIAMNIAEYVACDAKEPVGVFSLEMTAEALTLRMICSRARMNLRNVQDGFLTERDFPKLTVAAGKLANSPLYIDDTAGLSILQLRAKARRMYQQHGIKLFIIDYLQLLHSSSVKAENRQQEIAQISGGIKALAKELNVPVIVLAQLNRELEKDKSRKPRLSDLRESGAIEQDADLVGLLYKAERDEEDDGSEQDSEAIPVNLLIAKQRNGPTGDVHLTFLKSYTRFESRSRVADVPADADYSRPYND
jgi:replicative DNA helicase